MKKVLLFVAVVFAASFASCKKDYQCECTTTAGTVSTTATGGTFKETKKKAEEACEADSQSYGTVSVDCEAVKQ